MDASEVRLRCLELAISQCKIDGTYGCIEHVAEISTKFYNHITEAPEPVPETEPVKKSRQTKADKAVPSVFE
jgi:hypothetical protein